MEWREALEWMRPWLLPIITAAVSWWLYRRKYEAEVNDVFVNSAAKVVEMYKCTFDELKDRVSDLERQKKSLDQQIEQLRVEHHKQSREARRRMRLLAKVIVSILDSSSNGDPCLDDFIGHIPAEDRQFLNEIVEEVNYR